MKKTLIVVLSLALGCTACSAAWVTTLDSILAAAAPALINILQIAAIANGQPLDGNLTAKINADATVIRTVAADFARASAGSAPGACQQLQAALGAYQADQALVLQVAQVRDPNTQTKITLLAGLVAGTVQAITAVIPSCQNAASPAGFKAAPAYSVSTFVARYNRILETPTGNAAVDGAARKLKLHRHSKLVGALTFGRYR